MINVACESNIDCELSIVFIFTLNSIACESSTIPQLGAEESAPFIMKLTK